MYVQGRDVFVGRPKSSGEWLCSTILPTSLVNLPCLLEKHGWKRVDGHCTLKIAYRKLVLVFALVTSFCVTTFLATHKVVQVFPDVFPHIIVLITNKCVFLQPRVNLYVAKSNIADWQLHIICSTQSLFTQLPGVRYSYTIGTSGLPDMHEWLVYIN